ncbi:MAG: hypothetical protein KatS3mg034_1312 [Vicingaceae bacterium]|nr:MAG: hypothetical protein KatS3mg034_1312 [Vicingaceae bacterium]
MQVPQIKYFLGFSKSNRDKILFFFELNISIFSSRLNECYVQELSTNFNFLIRSLIEK